MTQSDDRFKNEIGAVLANYNIQGNQHTALLDTIVRISVAWRDRAVRKARLDEVSKATQVVYNHSSDTDSVALIETLTNRIEQLQSTKAKEVE